MRADRLIALLLLLQRRGRLTAAQAAAELEVSTRTARRDLEALAASGVPIYSTAGRGGGWQLIGGASTDLSGLSADEARALFLAAGPTMADRPELRSALRKLTSALPAPFQAEAEAAGSALKVDPTGWGRVGTTYRPPFLDELTDAVVRGRQIELDYRSRNADRRSRTVHPLGLVTKRNVWYLVAGIDGEDPRDPVEIRTYRVGRVHGVELLDQPVRRPPDFDLEAVWADIITEVEGQRRRGSIGVTIEIEPTMMGALRWTFGYDRIDERGRSADGRRVEVGVNAYDAQSFAAQIAGFGDHVTLVEAPDEVFAYLADLADQLQRTYGRTSPAAAIRREEASPSSEASSSFGPTP